VFLDYTDPLSNPRLYVVPLDGSSAPLLLSTGMPASSDVNGYVVDPDGEFAVYRSTPEQSLQWVPLDGSGPPVTISGTHPVASSTYWALSPDGEQVIYRAWYTVGSTTHYDLWRVATDGVSAPVQITFSQAPETDLVFDPVSARVLFHERGTTTRFLSLPLDGSASAVELVPTEATNVRFTPDGARVLFRADYPTANRFYVHARQIDGSGAWQILNGDLVAAGDVAAFELSADGSTVVYGADQLLNDKSELFTVPSDGSSVARLVGGPIPDTRDIGSLVHISPDGRFVAFTAVLAELSTFEPYVAPLHVDGPRRLVMDMPEFRDAQVSHFGPHGFQLLIWSDQNIPDVRELYLATWAPGHASPSGAPTRAVTRGL
jgi:hypothetical protein